MTTKLSLSDDLALPLEAITETLAILGIRGSGKTNTAVVIAEELLAQRQQVVIIDPTDVWYGLKSSADGKSPGYPVVVMGGKRGDLPLAATDGVTIADFVVDNAASIVLSLRHFESNASVKRFVTDFAKRLYYRKGQQENPRPIMVIIDEASLIVPQRVMGEDAAMVGAIQKLVRQGRSSGVGVTLIDQRPATVNKDVLAMLEVLVCHRVTSPQDRKALTAWVEQHDTKNQASTFLGALASLPQGTAWFWSPGWLNVFKAVRVRARSTFDSSRTPKAGEKVIAPNASAAVDLEALKVKLAATVEKAKADDPALLRKRIAELEKAARSAKVPDPVVDQEALDVAFAKGHTACAHAVLDALAPIRSEISGFGERIVEALQGAFKTVEVAKATAVAVRSTPMRTVHAITRVRTENLATNHNGDLSNPEQRIVDAIAWQEALGIDRPSKVAVAFLAGYTFGSGGFNNPCGALRTKGLIEYGSGGTVSLTDAGRSVANAPKEALTDDALHERVLARLPSPEQRILTPLLEVYPNAMPNEQLAAAARYAVNTGGYNNPRGRLRSLGLIVYENGQVRAADVLFPSAA